MSVPKCTGNKIETVANGNLSIDEKVHSVIMSGNEFAGSEQEAKGLFESNIAPVFQLNSSDFEKSVCSHTVAGSERYFLKPLKLPDNHPLSDAPKFSDPESGKKLTIAELKEQYGDVRAYQKALKSIHHAFIGDDEESTLPGKLAESCGKLKRNIQSNKGLQKTTEAAFVKERVITWAIFGGGTTVLEAMVRPLLSRDHIQSSLNGVRYDSYNDLAARHNVCNADGSTVAREVSPLSISAAQAVGTAIVGGVLYGLFKLANHQAKKEYDDLLQEEGGLCQLDSPKMDVAIDKIPENQLEATYTSWLEAQKNYNSAIKDVDEKNTKLDKKYFKANSEYNMNIFYEKYSHLITLLDFGIGVALGHFLMAPLLGSLYQAAASRLPNPVSGLVARSAKNRFVNDLQSGKLKMCHGATEAQKEAVRDLVENVTDRPIQTPISEAPAPKEVIAAETPVEAAGAVDPALAQINGALRGTKESIQGSLAAARRREVAGKDNGAAVIPGAAAGSVRVPLTRLPGNPIRFAPFVAPRVVLP